MVHDLIQLRLYIAKCKANNKLLLAYNINSIGNMIQCCDTPMYKINQVNVLHIPPSAAWCWSKLSVTISCTIDYRGTARV